MSLINTFQSFPEVSLLLLEVSRGKRNALLEKISEKLFKDYGELQTHQRVVELINNQPRLVEEMYKAVQNDEKFYKLGRDDVYERYPDFTFEIPEEYRGGELETWGVDGLGASMVMFHKLEQVDPTGNMKYGNWLVDVVLEWGLNQRLLGYMGKPYEIMFNFIRGERRFFEDLPKLESYLKAYDEMKQKNLLPDEYRDINRLDQIQYDQVKEDNPFNILNHITKSYRAIDTGDYFKAVKENLEVGEDYEIRDELQNFIIYEPLTEKGASILGINTEWCTTYGEHCTNPDYQGRTSAFGSYDNLLIMVNKNDPDEKYQMEVGSEQFMNKDDEYVNYSELEENHPELYEYLLQEELLSTPRWLKKKEKGWVVETSNIGQFISEFFKDNRDLNMDFVEGVLSGHGYEYFMDVYVPNLPDVYLSSETDKNSELVEMVKKEMYKWIKEFPDEFKESEYSLEDIKDKDRLTSLFEIISDVDVFSELGDAITRALERSQSNANESEAIDKLMGAFKDKWMVRDFDWNSGEILIEDDMVPNIVQYYNASGYGDEEDLVMVEYYPPRYGYNGDIQSDILHDALNYEFSEL